MDDMRAKLGRRKCLLEMGRFHRGTSGGQGWRSMTVEEGPHWGGNV